MNKLITPFTGQLAFRVLWAGQSISLLGTGLTRFSVMIWAYQQTGTAISLALLGFFGSLTYILASPFAGVWIDRLDRRKVMFLADLGSGLMTAALLALFVSGNLEIWHLYLAQGISGICEAFQVSAFSASVSLLVPRESYTRSNALLGLGKSAALLLAPALAGMMLPLAGLSVILAADLLSLSLALLGLLWIRIPAAYASTEGAQAEGSFWQQLSYGSRYILRRPVLRGLLLTFFMVNLFGTLTYFAVLSPMILARTGSNEMVLGWVRTLMGLGGIVGGLMVTVWGGARLKARTYLTATMLSFLVCDFLMAISRTLGGWAFAGFLAELSIPFIVSPYYALWQENIPADVQGKVFATREMVQVTSQPVGFLAGGLLADQLFEPFMLGGGWLPDLFGSLVGTGPGTGMAVMFLCTSLLGGLTGLLGLLSPSIRALDGETDAPSVGLLPEA